MESRFQVDGSITLYHLLSLVILGFPQVDDILIIDTKSADVIDLQVEVVIAGLLDAQPT